MNYKLFLKKSKTNSHYWIYMLKFAYRNQFEFLILDQNTVCVKKVSEKAMCQLNWYLELLHLAKMIICLNYLLNEPNLTPLHTLYVQVLHNIHSNIYKYVDQSFHSFDLQPFLQMVNILVKIPNFSPYHFSISPWFRVQNNRNH